jgi:hypothetical protein
MQSISTELTLGQSPKVVWPGIAVTVFGAGLLLLGRLAGNRGAEAAGVGALAAAAIAAPLGYAAPPGVVLAPDHDVRDVHEHADEPSVARFVPTTEEAVS